MAVSGGVMNGERGVKGRSSPLPRTGSLLCLTRLEVIYEIDTKGHVVIQYLVLLPDPLNPATGLGHAWSFVRSSSRSPSHT